MAEVLRMWPDNAFEQAAYPTLQDVLEGRNVPRDAGVVLWDPQSFAEGYGVSVEVAIVLLDRNGFHSYTPTGTPLLDVNHDGPSVDGARRILAGEITVEEWAAERDAIFAAEVEEVWVADAV